MFEKILHGGNFAACFGMIATTAVDVLSMGGAATGISAALSAHAVLKKDPDLKPLALQMGEAFEAAVKASPLSGERKKLIPQLMHKYPVSEDDLAAGRLQAGMVAGLIRERIEANRKAEDPGLMGEALLDAYEAILTNMLTPVLKAPAGMDPLQWAVYRELLAQSETSGRADALRDEGITEKAIIRLAQRIAAETEDVGQAWLELQNAMDIAVRVQKEGETKSNHPDFVDDVLARVAALAREGEYQTAGAEIDAALERAQAEQSRLLDSGVEVALLDRDTAKAARLLVRKADLEADGAAAFEALRDARRHHYEIGRDKGDNLQARLAIDLARIVLARANGPDEKGKAGNDLGNALATLGERDSDTARLEDAVRAYEDALREWTRDRVPMDWAMAKMNLGNALTTLGERDNDTARLEDAVRAYEDALLELTRDRVPLKWAAAKMNLGAALQALGARDSDTARLEDAVRAYEDALLEFTCDRMPTQWAGTKVNLGNALCTLGQRDSDNVRLEAAVHAYKDALLEFSRDRVPMNWAMAKMNLGRALQTLGARDGDIARLEEAVRAYGDALLEWTRDRVPMDWAMVQANLATLRRAMSDVTGVVAHLDRAEAHLAATREVF
ncbi:MAG: hypothetical protein AAFY38_13940 [Pseudomonadota bacterium]